MTPAELFTEWGAAWTTRDHDERLRRFQACCTDDVVFVPPSGDREVVHGVEALADHVTAYTASWPDGTGFELVKEPETHHDYSRAFVRWTFPGAPAIGLDIIRIAEGRIATMLVFAEGPTLS